MKFGDLKSEDRLVRVRRDDKAVAWIEMIDEVGQNSLSAELVGALLAVLKETDEDGECAAVILTGVGDYFSAGATKALLNGLRERRIAPSELILGEKLLRHSSIIIGAAAGHAIGGGFALLMAADMVVIAEEGRYGFNFIRHGITPGMGVTRLAEDFLGRPLAHQMLYTGDLLKGRSFRKCAMEVVPKSAVRRRASDLAYAVAENSPRNLSLLKRSLAFPRLQACQEACMLESLMHEISLKNMNLEGWDDHDRPEG